MEGADITLERLEHVTRALATSRFRNQVFSAFLGEVAREDFIPYTADFLLQVEDVKWTIVSGVVGGQLIVSVRNLGYSRNAGEFVKATFGDIGSAGGHRAMAKAVTPLEKFRKKFGDLSGVGIAARIGDLAEQFLSEPSHEKEKDKENKEKDKDRKPAAAVKAAGAPGPDRE
jgi:nanoRNase/pAp phosphatase (c-di-AMP/oligoRNAs hydrolase)